MGQKPGCDLAVGFNHKVSNEIKSDVGLGYSHLKSWRARGPISGWFTHITGKLLLAAGRKGQFPHRSPSAGCSGVLTAWLLALPSVNTQESEAEAAMCFLTLLQISHTVTFSVFHWSPNKSIIYWSLKSTLLNTGGHYTRAGNQGQEYQKVRIIRGLSWRLATTS